MTNSILQFRFSNDVHLISIYIHSDTHEEVFIPALVKIMNQIDEDEQFSSYSSNRLNWDYMVMVIIHKIFSYFGRHDQIKIINEIPKKDKCNTIYFYIIKPNDNYSKKNPLYESLDIENTMPLSSKILFNGKLKDYYELQIMRTKEK